MSSMDLKLLLLFAGYIAGYRARAAEETAALNPPPQVFTGRRWYGTAPAREREEQRMMIIREAHIAGVHGDGVHGCPWCVTKGDVLLDVLSRKPHNRDYGVRLDAIERPDDYDGDGTEDSEPVRAVPCDGLGCSCCSMNPCTCITGAGARIVITPGCPVHDVRTEDPAYESSMIGAAQMASWLRRRGVGLTPTPGTVARGVALDHADALSAPAGSAHGAPDFRDE